MTHHERYEKFRLASRARRRAGMIIETLEQGGELQDPDRARLHALTRKVTLTDEDLSQALESAGVATADFPEIAAMIVLRDIRDRYEERGKYAPSPDGMPAHVNIPDPE